MRLEREMKSNKSLPVTFWNAGNMGKYTQYSILVNSSWILRMWHKFSPMYFFHLASLVTAETIVKPVVTQHIRSVTRIKSVSCHTVSYQTGVNNRCLEGSVMSKEYSQVPRTLSLAWELPKPMKTVLQPEDQSEQAPTVRTWVLTCNISNHF